MRSPKRFYLVIFSVLILSILGVLKFNLLAVRQTSIQIKNAGCVTDGDIKSYIDFTGQNIFLINKESDRAKLVLKYPCIKEVIFIAHFFPPQVNILINGRSPLSKIISIPPTILPELKMFDATPSSQAALLDWTYPESSSSVAFIVDSEGVIFTRSDENLPIIFWPEQDFSVGKRLEGNLFNKTASILSKVDHISKAKLVGFDLQIWASERVTFSLKNDVLGQLASLQLILQKAKIDERVVETIDLRFDKPVVVYSPKNK